MIVLIIVRFVTVFSDIIRMTIMALRFVYVCVCVCIASSLKIIGACSWVFEMWTRFVSLHIYYIIYNMYRYVYATFLFFKSSIHKYNKIYSYIHAVFRTNFLCSPSIIPSKFHFLFLPPPFLLSPSHSSSSIEAQ